MRAFDSFKVIILLLFSGCIGNVEDPVFVPTPYELQIPQGFPEMRIPEDNALTKEGVALGRQLYYDKKLDKNGDRACATCHIQSNSFSTGTNVLPHVNLGWNQNFLWNGKITGGLEEIMRFEVVVFFQTNTDVLNSDPVYPSLFKEAFGVDEITTEEVAMGLAQFIRTLISGNSKFDKFLRGEMQFSSQELMGYELFYTEKGDCFHCHSTMFLTDNQLHNNALDSNPEAGYYEITGDSLDYGKFKSPTLRNIELTSPYMHDGRFATLEEVVEFYSTGLEKSPTVDPLMKNLSSGGVQLSNEEKVALVAFLKTLSDPDFINNPDLSDPVY